MNNSPTKNTQSAPRSMALRLPNWRGLSNRLMYRLTQDSTEMDALRDENLRLMAENKALVEWGKKAYAINHGDIGGNTDEILVQLHIVVTTAPDSVKGGSDPLIEELAADLGVTEKDLIEYAVESTGANE